MNTDNTLKCVVVGNASVGKTTLMDRLMNDNLAQNAVATIGVDCRLIVFHSANSIRVRFWDTAGCERFNAVTRIYYRGVDCALVCYSDDNEESLGAVEYWVNEIRKEHEGISKKQRKRISENLCCKGERYVELPSDEEEYSTFEIPILLVCTKCDHPLPKSYKKAQGIAEKLHITGPFFTSAHTMTKQQLTLILQPFFKSIHRSQFGNGRTVASVNLETPTKSSRWHRGNCCV
jgi:GTPase SAR1 family protein